MAAGMAAAAAGLAQAGPVFALWALPKREPVPALGRRPNSRQLPGGGAGDPVIEAGRRSGTATALSPARSGWRISGLPGGRRPFLYPIGSEGRREGPHGEAARQPHPGQGRRREIPPWPGFGPTDSGGDEGQEAAAGVQRAAGPLLGVPGATPRRASEVTRPGGERSGFTNFRRPAL